MNKQQVIEAFCKLSAQVGREHFKNQEAYDCFCGGNQLSDDSYKFSEQVMLFIEDAVKEKIASEKAKVALKIMAKQDGFAQLKHFSNIGEFLGMIKSLRMMMNGIYNLETGKYENALSPNDNLGLQEAKLEIERVFNFKTKRFVFEQWICKGIVLGHKDDETGVWVWNNL